MLHFLKRTPRRPSVPSQCPSLSASASTTNSSSPSSRSTDAHVGGRYLVISVTESTVPVDEFDNEKQKRITRTVPVFHVVIEDENQHRALIRDIHDFIELDQRIKAEFGKASPSLKRLVSSKHANFFSTLLRFTTRAKSNSRKIETYLRRCVLDPIIGCSSLLQDFLSPQCIKDRVLSKQTLLHRIQRQQKQNLVLAQSVSYKMQKRAKPFNNNNSSSIPSMALSNAADDETYKSDFKSWTSESLLCVDDQKMSPEDFELIKLLGKGSMGKVFLARKHQGSCAKLFAVKAISKERVMRTGQIEHTKQERDILAIISQLRHPFLIQMRYAFQDTKELYLAFDYHGGGDLATQLMKFHRFPPGRCKLYTAEILLGLQELHRLGILYRDLKPENILLGIDGHLVLTDFGFSKQFQDNATDHHTRTFCGTAEYLAPEIHLGQCYSYAVDLWSLGTIVYEMLTGIIPFWADNYYEMQQRVLHDQLQFPSGFCPTTANFISGLLVRDPAMRLGAGTDGPEEIRNHPYFADISWSDVYHKRIPPPYVPVLTDPEDVSHFDQEFVDASPRLSPPVVMQQNTMTVMGYSYINDVSSLDLDQSIIDPSSACHYADDDVDQYSESESDIHSGSDDLYSSQVSNSGLWCLMDMCDTIASAAGHGADVERDIHPHHRPLGGGISRIYAARQINAN